MNRVDKRFAELKQRNETAFIPFITAGDPDLSATASIILDLDKRGADVIEVGFPFSDPIADGTVIQASYNRALSNDVTVSRIFGTIKDVRKESDIPIVGMVSYSIVYKIGFKEFLQRAQDAGLDGVTIPDMPVEEGDEVFNTGREMDFKIVCFIAPTTTEKRMDLIINKSQGFLYYIAVVGITGERRNLADDLQDNLEKIRPKVKCPIAVGFGVSTPEQAKIVGKIADGVIVGSAIVREIERNKDKPYNELAAQVGRFTEKLIAGAKGRL